MHVTFLGTSGAIPTTERNTSGVCLRRAGERFLFDVGEGTQRQMMRYGTGFDVSHVFLSHLHGDHVLGLPGLVQTWDFNEREAALTVHTPPETRRSVEALLSVAGSRPSYPVRVDEVSAGSVALRGDGFEVRAFETDHRTTSVGYRLVEDDRKGRFDRERAEELGVPVGPKFSRLHDGESVELDDGRMVDPEQVVGDERPGRRVVYTGDTRPSKSVERAAEGADLLIHDATFADEDAERATHTGHSTAREAAELAARAGVTRLALTHVSSRYGGYAGHLGDQAREAFPDAFVAEDGQELDVPFPDAG